MKNKDNCKNVLYVVFYELFDDTMQVIFQVISAVFDSRADKGIFTYHVERQI